MGKREALPEAADRRGGKLRLILMICIAVLLVTAGGILTLSSFSTRIRPRVSVMGVDLGGQTRQQAILTLQQLLPEKILQGSLQVKNGEERRQVSYEQLGAFLPENAAEEAAGRAYAWARQGGVLENAWDYVVCLVKPTQLTVPLQCGEEEAARAAESCASEWDRPAVDFSYALENNTLQITSSRSGLLVDVSALARALREAVSIQQAELECPVKESPAKANDIKSLRDLPETAENAAYDPESKTCKDGTIGVHFDYLLAQKMLEDAQPGETISVPAQIQYPSVLTAQELEKSLFRDVLGSYTTYVSGSKGRLGNVQLSAGFCNGVILNSGEVFDYNKVIGKRTYSAGYQDAPAYLNGETVDLIGGGICQTSSTLYVAAVYSNLEIVSRRNHSFASTYVPLGYDATVSWGGPEFQFKNNTDYPIRIEVSWSGRNLTMKILGTNVSGEYARLETVTLEKIPYEVRYEDSADLAPGQERVKQTPYTGYRCKTYRLVYSADGTLLSRTLESSSNYKKRDKIVLRGPEAVQPSEAEQSQQPQEEPPLEQPAEETVGEDWSWLW